MATRYWRGGAGTWNAANTANWSATSGGAGGASAPTSADDVVFNSASNATAYTVTCTSNSAVCKSITVAGPASGNVTLAGNIQVYGDLTLAATGVTAGSFGVSYFSSTSQTITTNGVATGNVIIGRGSPLASGSYTLGSAYSGNQISLVAGSLNTANYNLTASTIVSSGLVLATALTLGSSTVTVANFQITSPLCTLSTGTSTINISGLSSSAFNNSANTPALTFYNVNFTHAARTQPFFFYKANTFNNLTFATLASTDAYPVISLYANQTVNGTLTLATNAVSKRYCVQSSTSGVSRTLSAGAVSLTNVDFRDIAATGAATWSGTSIGNLLGNTGIAFDAAKTSYFSAGGGGYYWYNDQWASTSGGTPAVGNYPLPQDTVVFDNNSGSGILLIYSGSNYDRYYTVSAFDASGLTSPALVFGIDANIGVLQNLSFGPNNSGSDYATRIAFLGRSTQTASFASVPILSFEIAGAGTTVNLASSPVFQSVGFAILKQGTLALNGYDLTLDGFGDDGGLLTRSVNFGSNRIYTKTINFGYATGLTFSGTGTFECDTTAWAGGDIRIYTPTYAGSTAGAVPVAITGLSGTSDWQIVYDSSLIKNLTVTSDTLPLTGWAGPVYVVGNLTLPSISYAYGQSVYLLTSGTVICSNDQVAINVNATGTYTTSGASTFESVTVTSGTFSLGANAVIYAANLNGGTFNLGTYTVSGYIFTSQSALARSLTFGTGAKFELGLGSGTSYVDQDATGLTVGGTYHVRLNSSQQAAIHLSGYSDATPAPTITDSGTSGIVVVGTTPLRIDSGSNLGVVNLPSYAGFLLLSNYGDDDIRFYHNVTIGSSATVYSATDQIVFFTAGSRTLSYSATSYTGFMDLLFAGTGTWTLQAALTLYGNIKLFTGTLNTNGYSVSSYSLRAELIYPVPIGETWSYGVNALTLGASTWTIYGGAGSLWAVDATNTTVDAGTSTISMSNGDFYGRAKTYSTLHYTGGDFLAIRDSNTFTTLSNSVIPGYPAGQIAVFNKATVTNFNLAGEEANPLYIGGTFSKSSGTVNASYLELAYSIATGGARWNAYLSNGNINDGGNVGWHFSADEPGKFFLLFS